MFLTNPIIKKPSLNFKPVFFLIAALLVCAANANGATRTWDGGGTTNSFSEAANWTDDTRGRSAL